ncbi:hypothetical protein NVS55_04300 [Myxococcus stipitatus]|uniref:hypothetical protein n=1 Tax=Myxococcus stipitatus TaxID=83455 RepID=UPI0031452CB3
MSRLESGLRQALGRLSVVVLSLGVSAPASAQVASPERTGDIRLRVGDRFLAVTLEEDRLRGGGFDLRSTRTSIEGRLHGEDVDLRWRGAGVDGRVGSADTRLELSRYSAQQGFRVDGELAGWPAALVVSPVGLSGDVGGCSYSLTVAGGNYTGWRTCQPNPDSEPISVALGLPENFRALGETQQAVLLSLLLSEAGLPPAPPRDASDSGRTLEGPGLDEGSRP